jgi:uncharacterized damage-inducible protein DinB
MKTNYSVLWFALILALASAATAVAQTAKAAAPSAGPRAEILSEITEAEEKLVALAEATPQDKYAWRPMDGVRTVSEVYMHVAGANFNIPQALGVKRPEGVAANLEKVTDKAKVVELLKQSFDHARQVVINTPDSDLDKQVKLFGRDSTVRGVLLLIATHAHEHLGQSIAYARMNKIVPPWTAKAQQSSRP